LAQFHSKTKVPIQAVVMDPQSQYFDVVFPQTQNNAMKCSALSFTEILKAHGSWRRKNSGRNMQNLIKLYEPLNQLRALHRPLMEAIKAREVCSKGEAINGYFLRGGNDLPKVVQQGLYLVQDVGVIEQLKIQGTYFFFEPLYSQDPFAYLRNTWMEDWVGSVLAKHDDGQWRGGFSSVKVNIKEVANFQEFDFLGARKNHLVYWSCKNTKETEPAQFFEIDALRDEVGGRDFHVAGLVHTANINGGLQEKAKRLGIHLVNILDNDAEEKLIRISCQ